MSSVMTICPSPSESTISSSMLSSLRASPPLYLNSASVSLTATFLFFSSTSVVKALSSSFSKSSRSSDLNTKVWQRESRGRITSNDGFSVVAPISVTMPLSTAPNRESCCDLLNRCISSINRIGDDVLKNRLFCAFSITSLTSFTPLVTALSVKKGTSSLEATIWASVVFPTPGGPHNIKEVMRPESIILRSIAPSPTRWLWPI